MVEIIEKSEIPLNMQLANSSFWRRAFSEPYTLVLKLFNCNVFGNGVDKY